MQLGIKHYDKNLTSLLYSILEKNTFDFSSKYNWLHDRQKV